MVASTAETFLEVLSYVPLVIFTLGVLGNVATFSILNFNKEMNKLSSMKILAYVSFIDIACISVWNLDHYFLPNHGFRIEYLNLPLCRILTFIQYFSLHASSLLFGFMTIDRYFTVISVPGSLASKLPFGTPRYATIWSAGILSLVLLINIHLLIFPGKFTTSAGTNETAFSCDIIQGYALPQWNSLANLLLANFIPGTIMFIFNSLLIRKTFNMHKRHTSASSTSTQRRHLTVSLILLSFLYMAFTIPSYILFGFFYVDLAGTQEGLAVLIFFDNLLFTQHALLFIECYIVNFKFREIVNRYLKTCFNFCRH